MEEEHDANEALVSEVLGREEDFGRRGGMEARNEKTVVSGAGVSQKACSLCVEVEVPFIVGKRVSSEVSWTSAEGRQKSGSSKGWPSRRVRGSGKSAVRLVGSVILGGSCASGAGVFGKETGEVLVVM